MSVVTTTTTATEIRNALAAAITSGTGINAQPYVQSNLNPPCVTVMRGPILYDQAMMGGAHDWTFLVRVYVASISDIGAQMNLDDYVSAEGDLSVKAAIEAERTLGGIVSDLHVTTATGETEFVREQGGPLLFSELTVEVYI